MSGRKWSQVTIQGEAKPGRSVYKVECLIHCNEIIIMIKVNFQKENLQVFA